MFSSHFVTIVIVNKAGYNKWLNKNLDINYFQIMFPLPQKMGVMSSSSYGSAAHVWLHRVDIGCVSLLHILQTGKITTKLSRHFLS